jgi:cystathionine beta-lyase
MRYDFDRLIDRRPTESAKWHYYDPDVLPMWVADMDFPSPEPIVQALIKRIDHRIFGYPNEPPELRSLIVERLWNLYHWQVTPDDLIFMPGVVTGFNLFCHAFGDPGDGVLIQTPVYPPFLSAPANAGLARDEMELTREADDSYSIDYEAFEAAIRPNTRQFILCNPHNPVGRAFSRVELERMAEICLNHDVLICSDEIHCDLLYSNVKHLPLASLDPEIAARAVTLMAPSKTYNIAGLECSFAVIQNPVLRKKFEAARQGMAGHANLLGLVASVAAYRDGQEWLDQLLPYLEANRDTLFDFVRDQLPGIHMGKPEATYLAWLDCRQAGLPDSPADFFVREARVGMNRGEDFGAGGEGFVRLNFGCPRSMLVEALERMRSALEKTAQSAPHAME